jgi:hypothetical protein
MTENTRAVIIYFYRNFTWIAEVETLSVREGTCGDIFLLVTALSFFLSFFLINSIDWSSPRMYNNASVTGGFILHGMVTWVMNDELERMWKETIVV